MASRLLLSALPLVTLTFTFIIRIVSTLIHCWRNQKKAVGFFHPYTNDGGGGERVLWCAVKAIQEESPDLAGVIFTGDHDVSPQMLAARAIDRFGVKLINPPKLCSVFGSCAHLAMVNSSWTQSHIQKLWGIPLTSNVFILHVTLLVFRFCHLKGQSVRQRLFLCRNFVQRRWAYYDLKAQPLQLEAFAVAIKNLDADLPMPKLQFVGSCRNEADEKGCNN